MASVTFDISSGLDTQNTSTITMAAGEKVRVRFTAFTGSTEAWIVVVANSTTTLVSVDSKEAFQMDCLAGDVVNLRVRLNGTAGSRAAGVLESGT